MPKHSTRTSDSLGKEKVGDKLGKNKPKRKVREGVSVVAPSRMGMVKGTMKQTRIRKTRSN
jgi:hypothetical protein